MTADEPQTTKALERDMVRRGRRGRRGLDDLFVAFCSRFACSLSIVRVAESTSHCIESSSKPQTTWNCLPNHNEKRV
jgi:hypothetical protein